MLRVPLGRCKVFFYNALHVFWWVLLPLLGTPSGADHATLRFGDRVGSEAAERGLVKWALLWLTLI